VLIALGLAALVASLISISVGEGGPGAPAVVGGVNDVQRILGGIPQEGAYLGPDDAEVTVTVFNDVQCTPCTTFETETVDRLVEEYARTGDARLEFRHFSLAPNDTTLGAIAAEAAGEQARQWQYIDTFARNIDLVDDHGVTDELVREVAEAIPNLEIDEWQEDYDDPAAAELVRDDAALAAELELPAEPAVVVSGPGGQRELIETPSYDEIAAAIDDVR
jgi:protein-disulfide isomerase